MTPFVTPTVIPANIIIPDRLYNKINISAIGKWPKIDKIVKPEYLSFDSNNKLLVTQTGIPQLTLIPFVNTYTNEYTNNTFSCGNSNIRYIKIHGNGSNNITIEIKSSKQLQR